MKSSALFRLSLLLSLWLLIAQAAHAGSINAVLGPVANDPSTPNDDMLVQLPLHWYPGANVQFYYTQMFDGTVLPQPMSAQVAGFLRDPYDVLASTQRALTRWADASKDWKAGFNIRTSLTCFNGPVGMMSPLLPDGTPYDLQSAVADGFNYIDFRYGNNTGGGGTQVGGINMGNTVLAATVISYFTRDFNLKDSLDATYGSNAGGAIGIPDFIVGGVADQTGGNIVVVNAANITGTNNTQNGQLPPPYPVFLPERNYKAGEIFDTDILVNASAGALSFLAPWPEDINAIPASLRATITRSIDLDMVMMHQFGWAFGLSNSMIYDSVMFPYVTTEINGNTPNYLTDQFRKRLFAFDDQISMAMAWANVNGKNYENIFPATTGAISGMVVDGATFGNSGPINNAAAGGTNTTGGTTGGANANTAATQQNPFIAQVPIFVGVRTDQLSRMPSTLTLNRPNYLGLITGHPQTSTDHADNIYSQPQTPGDPNQGDWRMMAQVLTGQALSIPASQGPTVTTGNGTGPGGGENGGGGGGGGGGNTTTTGPGPDAGTITQVSNINSLYLVPGLPTTDNLGQPINYAVYLPSQIRFNGGLQTASTFFMNQFHTDFIGTQPAAFYTYPNEFYGGVDVPLQFGRGDAPITVTTNDDKFMSNYIIGEMDTNGRIAAAINQGPTILSGYNLGPQSYVVLNMGGTTYSNRQGNIANVLEPVVVKDPPSGAQAGIPSDNSSQASGAWEENGKFRIRSQMKLSSNGGLIGIPAGLEVVYTITNISASATSMSLRQVLDANVFGRENPVYVVNGQYLNNSISLTGSQIPREILFQSWATTDTAIRGFVDVTGGQNTPPSWITIGTLGELSRILTTPGVALRNLNSINLDSGIALGWSFNLAPNEQKVIRYVVGFYPGGKVYDSWIPYPAAGAGGTGGAAPAGTQLTGFEDDPSKIRPVNVTAGKVTDGIDIFTNTFTGTNNLTNPQIPEGSATGVLQFIRLANGFPDYRDQYTVCGALGDIDNDGDLDIITCAVSGNNPGTAMLRVYLNEQRINPDGSTSRYFRDVTLGDNPNDPSGYRISPLHSGEDAFGLILADFDDDGWLELFVTQRGAQNRYYDNLGPEKPGFFVEDPDAIPGLLNGPQYNPTDVPFRAVAGDIDCDGDLDIIISQWEPFVPTYIDPATGAPTPFNAWVDSDGPPPPPLAVTGDLRMSHSRDNWSDALIYSERVLINYKYTPAWARNFNNKHIGPDGKSVVPDHTEQLGTYFVDETLGTDDAPGTLTSLVTKRFNNIAQYQYVVSWDPSELDRMPPVFPSFWSYSDTTLLPTGQIASAMGANAVEPRLGPLFGGSGLDLMSIRVGGGTLPTGGFNPLVAITGTYPSPPPDYLGVGAARLQSGGTAYGSECGYFRNIDLFSNAASTGTPMEVVGDGIPDGYFANMNYNMDYGSTGIVAPPRIQQPIVSSNGSGVPGSLPFDQVATAYGVFVVQEDNDSSSTRAFVRYDAFPLFTGIPDGSAMTQKSVGTDIIPAEATQSLAGLIGDWENRGHPMPMLFPDNTAGTGTGGTGGGGGATGTAPYLYSFSDTATGRLFEGNGIQRGSDANTATVPAAGTIAYLYGGIAVQYFDTPSYPYKLYVGGPWIRRTIQTAASAPVGQPYGAASGDFDRDGDEDVFVVNSSTTGIDYGSLRPGSGGFPVAPKAPKQVFINDSFGHFTDDSSSLIPNEPVNGMYCAVGDLDNDGDLDLVSFNMLGPNEAYINQAYTAPPNLLDDKDPTMFYDATYSSLPEVANGNFTGTNDSVSAISGITVGATVADLNGDGRPDLLLAEGGKFTRAGDFCRVLLNGGKPQGDGVPVYKPAGAAYPAPRTDLWVHNLVSPDGTYDPQLMQMFGVKYWDPVQRPSDWSSTAFPEGYMGGPKPGFVTDVETADVNNDGSPDVLIVRSGDANNPNMVTSYGPQLVINNDSDDQYLNSHPDKDNLGDAIFNDGSLVTITDPGVVPGSGTPIAKHMGQKAKFADFDGDGLPDIVIANGYPDDPSGRGAPNVILMNNKALPGHFTDATEQVLPAVSDSHGVKRGIYDNTLAVAVGDFNSDGHVDILFANDVPPNPASPDTAKGFRMLFNDGTGHFADVPAAQWIPALTGSEPFAGRHVKGIMVADIDGLGEPTEDKNFNGVLDPGEDLNHNGVIDWTDLPTETEDLNGNGILDPGEDGLIGPPNGKIDTQDLNNDGIFTARRNGVWDGSLDIVVSFDNDIPAVLINDPTNTHPGTFKDEALTRLENVKPGPNRGLDIGDINLDGYPDIAIAQYQGGLTHPVTLWLNQPKTDSQGHVKWGYFKDISYEVPYPMGEAPYGEVANNMFGVDDADMVGWAYDVKFLDIDGDGDLDMFVARSSSKNMTITWGVANLMYVNRIIGDGFNFKGYYASQKYLANPNVFSIWPRGAKRGTSVTITVTGENFQPDTKLSFGQGVAVTGIQPVDKSNLAVTLQVDAAATLGPRAVLVQNPSGSAVASKVGLFNVYDKSNLAAIEDRTWSLYN